MEVINPPGKKLAKRTSVHCGTVSWWNEKRGGLDNRFGLFLPEFSFYFLLLLSLCTAFLSRSKFKNCETKSCSSLDNYPWPYSFRLKLRIALGYVLEKVPAQFYEQFVYKPHFTIWVAWTVWKATPAMKILIIFLESVCCKKRQKIVQDQLPVWEVGDLWRTWRIPNWL